MNGYACNTCKQVHQVGEICPIPIHKPQKDFEGFLMDKYAESVNCTEMDTNDDEVFERRFSEWLGDLLIEEWFEYADEYANTFKLAY